MVVLGGLSGEHSGGAFAAPQWRNEIGNVVHDALDIGRSRTLMKLASLIVSLIAVSIAVLSFVLAQLATARSAKAEQLRNLLDEEKGPVAYGALRLLRDGLPRAEKERRLVVAAMIQACVFSGSDRARALLYRLIEENPARAREFEQALTSLETTFSAMDKYGFEKGALDLERGKRRVKAVRTVLQHVDHRPPP